MLSLFTLFLVTEPTSISPKRLTVNVNVYSQPITDSLIETQKHLTSNMAPIEPKSNSNQVLDNKATPKKRRKQRRKRPQLKQRSAFDESIHLEEETDDTSEDEEEDDDDENAKIY